MSNELLENQVAKASVASNAEERLRTRKAEMRRICQIPPNKYPTIELYNEVESLGLINYSSIEKRTAGSPHRADANVDAMVLKAI